jgi:hypothetical protein
MLSVLINKQGKLMPIKFECKCPVCLDVQSHATSINEAAGTMPAAGDVTICATCSALLEFDADLKPFKIDIKSLDQEAQDMIVMALLQLQQYAPPRVLH